MIPLEKFTKERIEWEWIKHEVPIIEKCPELAKDITKFCHAFGAVKLSNIGPPPFPPRPEPKNLWADCMNYCSHTKRQVSE